MTTTLLQASAPSLWRLAADRFARWRRRDAATPPGLDFDGLSHLSERTLRDIGAPESVHSRDAGVAPWMFERMRW